MENIFEASYYFDLYCTAFTVSIKNDEIKNAVFIKPYVTESDEDMLTFNLISQHICEVGFSTN